MKKQTAPWARIKRKQQGVLAPYREKKKSKGGFIIAVTFVVIALVLSFLRIPERIGMINVPKEENATPAMQLTSTYQSLLAEIEDMEQESDWDGDGLKNGADLYPRDMDADRNGISDGYEGKQIISGDFPIQYMNAKLVVSNAQSGIVFFQDDWHISSFAGWIAFENAEGTPYVLSGSVWKEGEYEWIGDTCYVNVSGSCRIRFSDSRKPDDRDVLIDAVPAEYENRPDERYSIANAPLSQLEKLYSSIDNGKTVQISILTNQGEQLLLVHGYDKFGNLIVANCDTLTDAGKIDINVKSQVFWDGQKTSMRSWFEFSWGELSSQNGDVLTVF